MSELIVQAQDLKKLGLTEYQAKALLALMVIGAGTPRDVASQSGIPYPSAYDSLRTLAEKGWIEAASTRPVIFRAREPKIMKDKVTEELAKLFESLEKQYESVRSESSKLQLIYTIIGRDQVQARLNEMIRSAEVEVFLVIPKALLDDPENNPMRSFVYRKRKMKGRTVNFRILTDLDDDQSVLPGGAEVRVRNSVLAVDLLVDQSKAMIALPDLSACGWIDSPAIASHFGQFLELMWRDSPDPSKEAYRRHRKSRRR